MIPATYTCQCGCGQPIPPKPSHKTRPPRYILLHYLKLGTSTRIEKSRESKRLARMKPPPNWKIPSGLCECGCGQKTQIAKDTSTKRDHYMGYPRRYVNGHFSRMILSQRGSNHPRWKGGRRLEKEGYVQIYMPDAPGANRDGNVLEHRYVYEQTRGITLPPKVHIHHINGIRHDNGPENLIAFTRGAHSHAHQKAGEILAMFLDDKLFDAARQHVKQHGTLPDLEQLTQTLYATKEV